jgi:hypothetical protein
VEAGRCQGTNAAGNRCNAKALPGDRCCPWHSPAWADRRKAWSAKGGASRSNAARARKSLPEGVMTAVELQGLLGTTIKGVKDGTIEPGPANAIANLSRSYAALFGPASFEERLTALERGEGHPA